MDCMDKKLLGGEAPPGSIGASTGSGAPVDPKYAIGPIFKQVDSQWVLIGTGFFITIEGIFVTARHVLMDVIDTSGKHTRPIAIMQFTSDNTYAIRPILRFSAHGVADAAVGVTVPMRNNITNDILKSKACVLTSRRPAVGERACTFAYPNIVDEPGPPQKLHLFPAFYDGRIEEYYPEGRDRISLPAPCYRTSISIHGGASGGPVFDGAGHVFGINSTGFMGAPDISYVTQITDILPLIVSNVGVAGRSEKDFSIHELAILGHVPFIPKLD